MRSCGRVRVAKNPPGGKAPPGGMHRAPGRRDQSNRATLGSRKAGLGEPPEQLPGAVDVFESSLKRWPALSSLIDGDEKSEHDT